MDKYVLESKQLTKKFGKQTVLHNIGLKVPRGHIYGLLGVNGAGKSTLMKIVTGIITSYQGELFFDGKKWNRAVLSQIGSLIEYPGAYANLSAAENMKIIALEEGLPQAKIPDTLAQLKIGQTGKQKVGSFSLGMKQRLGIAMAMLKDPELLLLDEPFNGLDPYGIKELKDYLRQLTHEGKTVLVSSHILPEIQDISEDIGIISQGALVYQQPVTGNDDLEKIFFEQTKERR